MKDDSVARSVAAGLRALIVAAVSLMLTLVHAAVSQPFVSLDGLARFGERAPFQHRLLVPLFAAAGKLLTPWPTPTIYLVVEACAWAALVACARQIVIGLDSRRSPWTTGLVALTVVFPVSAQVIWPARFRVFAGVVPIGDINAIVHPFSHIVALPNLYYPWDVPSAAFVLAIIACVLRLREAPTAGRVSTYLAIAAVACLNRETTVLLVPLSVWSVWRSWPRGRSIAFGAAQVMAWAILMGAIAWASQAPPNDKATLPGGVYEWYLWTNLRTLTYPLYVLTTLVPLAAGAWLPTLLYWRAAPPAARAVAILYVVPAMLVAIAFGVLHETRIFTEPAAALWVVALFTIHARTERPHRSGALLR